MRRAVVAVVVAWTMACSSPQPQPQPQPVVVVSIDAGCALEGEEVEGFDFDGDGDVDRLTTGYTDMHGNTEFTLYRVGGVCPEKLGTIEAFKFDRPSCVEPPVGGKVCRMTANRRMHHDDYQEYFWVLGPAGFEKDGAGQYIAPSPRYKSP